MMTVGNTEIFYILQGSVQTITNQYSFAYDISY